MRVVYAECMNKVYPTCGYERDITAYITLGRVEVLMLFSVCWKICPQLKKKKMTYDVMQ